MKVSVKTKLDEQAYRRDDYRCVDCGAKGKVEAHHIISGLEILDNLVTLCRACHKRRHNFSGCFKKGDKRGEKTWFQKGFDSRRFKACPKGRPFFGNRYCNADGSVK